MTSIPRIKEAISLPALIAEYVDLRAVGTEHICCCPFHDEKTPSFRVHASYWHCFGCGATGDCIDFLARIEGISKGTAIKMLSERTGIPLDGKPQTRLGRVYDRQEREFAEWWRRRMIESLGRQITGCVRWGTDERAEELGTVLRQVRGAKNLRALVERAATDRERSEYSVMISECRIWADILVNGMAHA